ncbi:hypothetical protein [Baaleninema sp.]|uniref:hypothetical protein n=1 Tax=Baaleninema sp. TaxID=3101197 RepID=UPI003D08E579
MHEPLLDSQGKGKPNKSPVYYTRDRAARSTSDRGTVTHRLHLPLSPSPLLPL